MSNGRIGPSVLASSGLDPLLVLAIPHPHDLRLQINFALDEVIVPTHNDVIEYWRDRAVRAEAAPIPYATEEAAPVNSVKEACAEANSARVSAMDRVGEVDQRAEAANHIGDGANKNFFGDTRTPYDQAAKIDHLTPGDAVPGNFTGTFGGVMDGLLVINGTPQDKIGSILAKLSVALANGLEVHIGKVGFNQIAVVGKEGARPFSQMPEGRYLFFPEG